MPVPAALEPLHQVYLTFAHLVPSKSWFKRPRFHYITIHYFYMLGLSILGSIILFPGDMPYIDALFFAAGAATQSGLNTIDVNLIYLYQQIVLYLVACIANPIFINLMVVFVRLYWFEKRFKHIVKESRELRKTKSFTKSRKSEEITGDIDAEKLERGVNGRPITVLHETTRPNAMTGHTSQAELKEAEKFAEKMGLTEVQRSVGSNESSSSEATKTASNAEVDHSPAAAGTELASDPAEPSDSQFLEHRTITFPDNLPAPPHPSLVQHIAIVKRQQESAQAEGGTLRIPGPRDFDRGEVPEEISDSEHPQPLSRHATAETILDRVKRMSSAGSDSAKDHLNSDDHPVRRGITINEPERPERPHRTEDDDNKSVRSHMSFRSAMSRVISPLRQRHRRTPTADLVNEKLHSREASQILVMHLLAQREELGGIEYRSLKLLAKILIAYYLGFHFLGLIVYVPWIVNTQPWKDIVIADGINPSWWGIFSAASLFNDLGLTLTPDSMISFNNSVLLLLLGSFLIIIGNTGFPVMLRFIIWSITLFTERGTAMWEELRFLLDHPRRCFTLLFPSRANWWLFWILILFNVIDLVFFIILDLNDPTVTDLPPGYRVLNGWFQATSTRTAGFSSVNLADLHPAIQVSYMIMMYISVLPIAISVRRTNVYEEKSLGIWGGEEQADMENPSYVGQHLRRQLSFDLWYIFFGFFIITIVEGTRLAAMDDPAFNMFSVLFEIVSAYGTVGLSLGYPTINASFSAEFHTLSKLVIVAMMIRGRHRGLPYALDRAILLPSEKQYEKEAEDADRRYERRGTGLSQYGGSRTWEQGELDESGLPRQHVVDHGFDPMSAGAGGDRRPFSMDRRGSAISNHSNMSKAARSPSSSGHRPRTSFATLLASGLSAGPTFSKRD
ncbi:hypothetical protein MRB53_038742 [Persea americana]|nr:hypothetical protein MRB53_038742 [Persea americana]